MTNFSGVDIIMDVAQAADPARRQLAVQRLSDIAASYSPETASFGATLDSFAHPSRFTTAASLSNSPLLKINKSATNGSATAGKAAQQFEAFILQTFIEQILPSEKTGLFGDEASGGIWRSLMAEQLASTVARAGGIGLGKVLEQRLAKDAVASATPHKG